MEAASGDAMIPEALVVGGSLALLFGVVRADDRERAREARRKAREARRVEPTEPTEEPERHLRGRSRLTE